MNLRSRGNPGEVVGMDPIKSGMNGLMIEFLHATRECFISFGDRYVCILLEILPEGCRVLAEDGLTGGVVRKRDKT